MCERSQRSRTRVLWPGGVRRPAEPAMIIKARFNGPAGSGNGGYTCGLIADRLPDTDPGHGTVEVTLLVPPPLDTPLTLRADVDHTGVYVRDALIAQARPA